MFVGGAGSIQSMIMTLRNNKNLLLRRTKFDRRNLPDTSTDINNEPLKFVGGDKNIVRAIRSQKKSKRKFQTILIGVVLLASLGTAFLISYDSLLNPKNNHSQKEAKIIEQRLKEIKARDMSYVDYVNSGDTYFSDGEFLNAVYMYEKALKLYPRSNAVKQRLERTYDYACRRKQMFCEKLKRE